MRTTTAIPTEMKVLMNHIYELHKGVRHMVLFTCNKKYSELAIQRLESQGIPYLLQPAGQQNLNVYFGRRECLEAIRLTVTRPLNQLTPEEDFILGAMLGYDICAQCERSQDAQVYGIDISEESVAKAKKVNANVLDEAGFTQTEIHRKKPTYATIIGVKK